MKKLFFTLILIITSFSICEASDYLTNRLGIGANWQGLQLRYGISDDWLAEAKMQFASNNTLAGGRVYRFLPELPRTIFPMLPYFGGEANWVFSDYLKGGILSGVFCGLELLPSKNLGLGCDVGLYYDNLWSNFGTVADIGVIGNLNVTFYF